MRVLTLRCRLIYYQTDTKTCGGSSLILLVSTFITVVITIRCSSMLIQFLNSVSRVCRPNIFHEWSRMKLCQWMQSSMSYIINSSTLSSFAPSNLSLSLFSRDVMRRLFAETLKLHGSRLLTLREMLSESCEQQKNSCTDRLEKECQQVEQVIYNYTCHHVA